MRPDFIGTLAQLMKMRQLIWLTAIALFALSNFAAAFDDTLTWGTIASAPDELRGIYDWELADLIAQKIGTDADILIVNGACYGGDFLDNFNSTPGESAGGATFDTHSFSNTTIVTGNAPGLPTYDNAWHRYAARRIAPGNTANDIKDVPKYPLETPQSQGDLNKPVGGANSTHVLTWAGQPDDDIDRRDIDQIKENFKDHPNTTVHTLADSDPASGPTNGVSTGPATLGALENALDEIARQMGPGEQFIMYIGDHGDIHKVQPSHTAPPATTSTLHIPMTQPVLDHMVYDASNHPSVTLYFDPSLPASDIESLSLSLNSHAPISLSDLGWHVDSIVLPGNQPAKGYTYRIPESFFDVFTEQSASSPGQTVDIFNAGQNPINILYTELGSGQLARLPVPEPNAIVMIVLSFLCFSGVATLRNVRSTCATS